MYRGYVKLWRKSLDTVWIKNSKLWWFWCWCLMKASYKECDLTVGFQQVHLMPGDFVFGRKKASEETELSEQEIRTCIDFLKKSENLTIKTTNKFSLISITNWNVYQGDDIPYQPANQPTNNQQITTNKHNKNEKNIFIIPTVEQVRAYCIERGNNIDPEKFVAFYESNGWMVGKNKMKKWQSAIITWEGRDNGRRTGNSGRPAAAFRKEEAVKNNSEQFPIDAEF